MCTSSAAYASSESCGSEVDDEDDEAELSPRNDGMQSILTCSLSKLNIPSLVNTPSGEIGVNFNFILNKDMYTLE